MTPEPHLRFDPDVPRVSAADEADSGGGLAMFVGSTLGDTRAAGERIADALAASMERPVPVYDIDEVDPARLQRYDKLLIGCSTWNVGELQAAWDRALPAVRKLDLRGIRVALFGSGDQLGYPDTFQDALGILAETFEATGATLDGAWPVEGYEHVASRAQRGDAFVGLALDADYQPELTDERIRAWTSQLAATWRARESS